MFGAKVSASFASGDQLAIQTDGSVSGMTFVTFNVADADLCASIVAGYVAAERLVHRPRPSSRWTSVASNRAPAFTSTQVH